MSGFAIAILGVVLLVAAVSWHLSRSRDILQDWARDQGFEIVDSEERQLMKGPFFWTSSRGQVVFYVTVRDSKGRLRKGWVRCGSFLGGLFSDHAEVRWDTSDEDHPARDWMGNPPDSRPTNDEEKA